MGHFEQVEQAWSLSEAARDHANQAGRELAPGDYLDFFAQSPLVDVERSRREGGLESGRHDGDQPPRIFLISPYGLQWREAHKDWVPFRHGEVDLNNI